MKVKEGEKIYLQNFDATEFLRRTNTPDEKEDVQNPDEGKIFSEYTGDSAVFFDTLPWLLSYNDIMDLSFSEIEEMEREKKAAYDAAIQAQKMAPVTRYKEASIELFARKYEYEEIVRYRKFLTGEESLHLPGKIGLPKCLDEARAIGKKRKKGGLLKKIIG